MYKRLKQSFEQLGPVHAKVQGSIFAVFFATALIEAVFKVVSASVEGTITRAVVVAALISVIPWIVAMLLVALGWWLASLRFCLDLRLYYLVWLRVRSRRSLSLREEDIVDSFEGGKRPKFILARDLMRKHFWPRWVFAVTTLFGQAAVTQDTDIDEDDDRTCWKLSIDLAEAHYGIYSNQGKDFLQRRFLQRGPEPAADLRNTSHALQSFMSPDQVPGKHWAWNDAGPILPIRWASGGFLPIVHYLNDYWVLLFFRDRKPVGLNVPNGASEDLAELKDIRLLMMREFSEEVVVLTGPPAKGAETLQVVFQEEGEYKRFEHPEFARKQICLRKSADDLRIALRRERPRKVHLIPTPFKIETRWHDPVSGSIVRDSKGWVVYTVNPAECGIESMQLCWFDLYDEEYLLDGEYDISRFVLIRRPPVLLRLRYLRGIFEKEHSLGRWLDSGDSIDGKLLDDVPAEHCKIFDKDVEIRKERKKAIEAQLKDRISRRERENLEWELKEIVKDWLENYERPVLGSRTHGLQGNGVRARELRTMCPVTWKTLELAFEHNLFTALPSDGKPG